MPARLELPAMEGMAHALDRPAQVTADTGRGLNRTQAYRGRQIMASAHPHLDEPSRWSWAFEACGVTVRTQLSPKASADDALDHALAQARAFVDSWIDEDGAA